MTTELSTPTLDFPAVFKALDDGDAEAFGAFLAPDAEYYQGNNPPVVGRDQIVSGTAAFLSSLESIRHDIDATWPTAEGFVCRMTTIVTLPGAQPVSMLTAAVSTVVDGLIRQHRVYIDVSPLAPHS